MQARVGVRPVRVARVAAVVSAMALVVAACGGDDESDASGSSDEQVELRFSWWGSDSRHEQTQEIIDAFEAENPNITIEPDFTDWGSYWDKLATTVAADDAPDIMTQEERYLRDYGSRGALLDLSETDIDTGSIDPMALGGGEMDGALYGIATGVNAYAVVADPQVFADAGVEMPDDTTWTWQDYVDIANQISTATPEGVYGAQDYGFNEAGFNIFARQRGESLYAPDGSLGYSDETLAEWWQYSLDLSTAGGSPDAARSIEIEGGGPDQSLTATNSGAMSWFWTNQLGALTSASGRDLELLRPPGESENDRTGMYLKPAMFYSISAQTEHPEEAALFVDYLLNSEEPASIMLNDRGLPANTEVRESILSLLEGPDVQVAEFMEEITPDIEDAPPVPPVGAGEVVDIMNRLNGDVLHGGMTPEEAAAAFTDEVSSATGN